MLIKDFYLNDNATMAETQGRPFNKIIGTICRSVVRVFSWCDMLSDQSFMVDPLSYFSCQPVLHNWCSKRPWYVQSCLFDGAFKNE